ncbi:oxidized purine nucleoside triphosphate hydrolase-like [Saccoglossus kowalevskii]|uniref:Oxidized purine nucleoside triphosphate hydrolase n=1 Tax=Saccoglossus kowalevskii TaxID=10224 RepID=A0ABM0GML8_SACKO|nr:PREDICTED: 7,8-dihydro-8-oxoguanine triphosphatase-like [Saccoglossus kowalevskii]
MSNSFTKKVLTLVFIQQQTKILLGLKKRGFGRGKWNGFGGKVEPGESIKQAAHRELNEECSITSENLERIGLIDFEFEDDPQVLEVHVYKSNSYKGQVIESEEMQPQWFEVDSLPFNQMWLDDEHWFPYMLRGVNFYGYFLYKGHNTILSHRVEQVDTITSYFQQFRSS